MAVQPSSFHPWYSYWLIYHKKDALGIGVAGYKGKPTVHGEVELGYELLPHYRQQGYMSEALPALLTWAFDSGAKCVTAKDVLKTNLASQRVLEKLGMRIYDETLTCLYYRLKQKERLR